MFIYLKSFGGAELSLSSFCFPWSFVLLFDFLDFVAGWLGEGDGPTLGNCTELRFVDLSEKIFQNNVLLSWKKLNYRCCLKAAICSKSNCALSIWGEFSSEEGSIWISDGYIQGAWLDGRGSSVTPPAASDSSSSRDSEKSASVREKSSDVSEVGLQTDEETGLRFREEISSAEEWIRDEYRPKWNLHELI